MNANKLLNGLSLILLVQFFGTLIIDYFNVKFPPALFGMILMSIFLLTNVIKVEWVEDTCQLLLQKMGILFLPAGVSIMLYLDIIAKESLAILATVFISTIVITIVTGLSVDFLLRKGGNK